MTLLDDILQLHSAYHRRYNSTPTTLYLTPSAAKELTMNLCNLPTTHKEAHTIRSLQVLSLTDNSTPDYLLTYE